MPISYVAHALEVDESRGFMKAVVDAQSKQILGFTVLGLEGGEQDAIFAHPTIAESPNHLFAIVA